MKRKMHFNLIMEKQNESQMYSEGKMQGLLEKVDDCEWKLLMDNSIMVKIVNCHQHGRF